MRILLVNDYTYLRGGAEKFVLGLKKALEEKGHNVEILGSDGDEDFSSIFSRWYSFKWYKKTKDKIREFNPDIVHINNCWRIVSPSVSIASRNLQKPVILTIHDYSLNFPKISNIRNLQKIIRIFIHRIIVQGKDITFTSPSKFLSKKVGGSLRTLVKTIPNGIEIPREKTNYRKNIIFVGEINNEKGLSAVAKALNDLKNYNTNILGEGNLREYLESKYDQINFLGFQKPEDYYKNSSILVMPSIWEEPFGLSITEAMSYGLCVIASNIGGIPEQIKHMRTGLLFEPGDQRDFEEKLNYLLQNPKKIKRMGKNARKFVKENLSWDKIINQWENAYREAIRKNEKT